MPPTTPNPTPVPTPAASRTAMLVAGVLGGLLVIGIVAFALGHRSAKPAATPVPTPTFTGNAQAPASGTKTVDITMKDGKLASGPASVNLSLGQYILFRPRAFAGTHKLEFYVDTYGEFEVDISETDGSTSGVAYFRANQGGSFAYGIDDETTNTKTPLGQLVVQ